MSDAIWPLVDPSDPFMNFDPSDVLLSGHGFFLPKCDIMKFSFLHFSNFRTIFHSHSWAIWPLVDPGWPLCDLQPCSNALNFSWVLPTKFGGHILFPRQLDLQMTFDLWWGLLRKIDHKPSFSLIHQSVKKHKPGQTYLLTNQICFFSNYDGTLFYTKISPSTTIYLFYTHPFYCKPWTFFYYR